MNTHVFVSYAKKDTRELAEYICDEIRKVKGLTAWMDRSLEVADSWADQIENEIERCSFFVLLLSPDINRHKVAKVFPSFVLKEISFAQNFGKQIIPVMVQETRLPIQIADLQYMDLTKDVNVGVQRLISHICQKAGIENSNIWSPVEISINEHLMVVLPMRPFQGRALCIGKYPVTNEQYKTFVDTTRYKKPKGRNYSPNERNWTGTFLPWEDPKFNMPNQPVVCVTYSDSLEYCRWLSSNSNVRFSLPSTRIWDFAAFGSQYFAYNPKDWFTPTLHPIHKSQHTSTIDDIGTRTNKQGLSDMIGNIWEWCLLAKPGDINSYLVIGATNGAALPGLPPLNEYIGQLRGGSFLDDLEHETIPQIDIRLLPDREKTSHSDLGFRICCAVPLSILDSNTINRLNQIDAEQSVSNREVVLMTLFI